MPGTAALKKKRNRDPITQRLLQNNTPTHSDFVATETSIVEHRDKGGSRQDPIVWWLIRFDFNG